MDNFQVAELICLACVSHLTKGLVTCPKLANIYLWKPMKSNAKKIVSLHETVHQLPGMLGSLNVTKIC